MNSLRMICEVAFINLLKIQILWLHDSHRDAYPFKLIHPTNLVMIEEFWRNYIDLDY